MTNCPIHPVCDAGSEGIDTIAPPWASLDSTLPGDYVCRDAPRTLTAWTELVENLDAAPLFPLETLAALAPNVVTSLEYTTRVAETA